MDYLITGGAGFVGSHLADKLLKNSKNKIYVLDNLITGTIKNIDPLEKKYGKKRLHFENLDLVKVENERELANYIDRADFIYHLAAKVGVKTVEKDTSGTIHTNLRISEKIIEGAKKQEKPVLFTSTSEVYGKNEKIPFKEDGDVTYGASTQPRWSYGASKLIDEMLFIDESKKNDLPFIVVRLFNTVGPGQTGKYGMVIPRFVEQALKNKPIEVYGDGKSIRCFGDVDDITDALIMMSEKNKKLHGEVFNLGNPNNEIEIYQLAELIKEKTNSKSEIKYIKDKPDLIKIRVPDITKIKNTINWEPKITLDGILDRVIKYERKKLEK